MCEIRKRSYQLCVFKQRVYSANKDLQLLANLITAATGKRNDSDSMPDSQHTWLLLRTTDCRCQLMCWLTSGQMQLTQSLTCGN